MSKGEWIQIRVSREDKRKLARMAQDARLSLSSYILSSLLANPRKSPQRSRPKAHLIEKPTPKPAILHPPPIPDLPKITRQPRSQKPPEPEIPVPPKQDGETYAQYSTRLIAWAGTDESRKWAIKKRMIAGFLA